jgi:hypothetical protein
MRTRTEEKRERKQIKEKTMNVSNNSGKNIDTLDSSISHKYRQTNESKLLTPKNSSKYDINLGISSN